MRIVLLHLSIHQNVFQLASEISTLLVILECVAGLPRQLDGQWSGFAVGLVEGEVLGHDRSLGDRLATDMHFTEEVQERVILMKQV